MTLESKLEIAVAEDQPWFHHPDVQDRIRRAEEDLASGRCTRTETLAEALAFLDALEIKPWQKA
jgi:hypothetical protein